VGVGICIDRGEVKRGERRRGGKKRRKIREGGIE
jgi:hypothetical protein